MSEQKTTIVGAGLAGLLAAHAWPRFPVVEAAPEPRETHKAVLRFRNDSVSRLTGVEFKKVRVRKGIWSACAYRDPSIRLANMYAQKVLGTLAGDRSIWNLDPADRFIAPPDFYEQLVEATRDRVTWGTGADFSGRSRKISTAPLPVVLAAVGIVPGVAFQRSPIQVVRATVPGAAVYQTVYFPDDDCLMYRASITGDQLILEATHAPEQEPGAWVPRALVNAQRAFGLKDNIVVRNSKPHEQKYGKIASMEDATRKSLVFKLSHEHGVYSLGRFATWRNILLDDVVDDIAVIKRLLRASEYELRRQHA